LRSGAGRAARGGRRGAGVAGRASRGGPGGAGRAARGGRRGAGGARLLLTEGRTESARPTYEKARDELTDLVKRLEAGGLTLEQSLELWERGERLAAICEDWLEGARARLAAAAAQQDEAEASSGTPF
jgi:exodeoxyribonuclease VII small subunit